MEKKYGFNSYLRRFHAMGSFPNYYNGKKSNVFNFIFNVFFLKKN